MFIRNTTWLVCLHGVDHQGKYKHNFIKGDNGILCKLNTLMLVTLCVLLLIDGFPLGCALETLS